MSQTEVHKGIAYPLGLTISEFLEVNPQLVEDHYKTKVLSDPREVFYNGLTCGYNSYVEVNEEVYRLDNLELNEYDFSFAERGLGGSFKYVVQFYNGGCSLDEAISDAIEKELKNV